MTTLCLNPACKNPRNTDQALTCRDCGLPLLLVNRYRCCRLLGQGGFGRTYLAQDEYGQPPQVCVVKQCLYSATGARQRFQIEAEQLRELGRHPYIPQLLDAIELESGQYLVQQYIEGETLEQAAQKRSWDEPCIRRLLTETLTVLQFIHAHHIIHRDIKPTNILLLSSSQHPVIVDFGAAKAVLDIPQKPESATVIGSAGFAAPEQVLGKAVYASDIYSLGVSCLYALTGLHPFDLYSVSEDAWRWRPYIRSPVSRGLGRILDRMIARGLSRRYPSATAVLDDLRSLPTPGSSTITQPTQATQSIQARQQSQPPTYQPKHIIEVGAIADALAISPNGRAIAIGARNRTLGLWDADTGERIHTFGKSLGIWGSSHRDAVVATAFSPDGHTLISGSRDGHIYCWNLATYRLEQSLLEPNWELSTLVVSPRQPQLVSGGADGHLYLWNWLQGRRQGALTHHQGAITALALGPTGEELVSSSRDRTLRRWSLPQGQLIQTWKVSDGLITALAWVPDGSFLTGDDRGLLQRWRNSYGPQRLMDCGAPITTLALSPQGWLAIGLETGAVEIWQLEPPSRIAMLKHGWPVQRIIVSANGDAPISSSQDEQVYIWPPIALRHKHL